MKNSIRVAVYAACITDSSSLNLSARNLLLSDVAHAMDCKHFAKREDITGITVFSLHRTDKYGVVIPKPLYQFRLADMAWNQQ